MEIHSQYFDANSTLLFAISDEMENFKIKQYHGEGFFKWLVEFPEKKIGITPIWFEKEGWTQYIESFITHTLYIKSIQYYNMNKIVNAQVRGIFEGLKRGELEFIKNFITIV